MEGGVYPFLRECLEMAPLFACPSSLSVQDSSTRYLTSGYKTELKWVEVEAND